MEAGLLEMKHIFFIMGYEANDSTAVERCVIILDDQRPDLLDLSDALVEDDILDTRARGDVRQDHDRLCQHLLLQVVFVDLHK